MTAGNYPVLAERALAPVRRPRAFRAPWRDPSTLPAQMPGSVYVFEYNGRYRDPYARLVHGSEQHVIDATAVSVVEVRDRLLPVVQTLPSARHGVDLAVTVTFRCKVTNPAAVAQAGLTDLMTILSAHVCADRELATLGRGIEPDRSNEARVRIEAQLRAHCDVNPPEVGGIACTLASVAVHPVATQVEFAGGSSYVPPMTFAAPLADPVVTARLRDEDFHRAR